jgi:hypothetical protein
MDEGVFIFDVSDENNLRFVSSILPDVHFPKRNPNRIEHPNARGLAIHDRLLFVAYDAGGLRVIDIADRSRPREIARYINGRMARKQQAYNNVAIAWPYAYIATDYCGMEVVDVRNPAGMRQAGWWNPWNCQSPTNNWFNSPGHTNQLALDDRRRLVYLSAGDSELQVVDVSNPARPALAAEYGRQRDRLGVWGLAVTQDMIYLAYIRTLIPFQGTWAGVKALARGD